jgi:hypothetical protein
MVTTFLAEGGNPLKVSPDGFRSDFYGYYVPIEHYLNQLSSPGFRQAVEKSRESVEAQKRLRGARPRPAEKRPNAVRRSNRWEGKRAATAAPESVDPRPEAQQPVERPRYAGGGFDVALDTDSDAV